MTETIPKSLIEIGGEPFLAHQLRLLAARGIQDVVLCAGFLGETIQSFAGDGSRFGVHLSYSFDGHALLGTAGAIRHASHLLPERFLVLYGDSYLECDYAAIASNFVRSAKRGLMTIYRNAGQFDTSNVEAENDLIIRYDKKSRSMNMHYIDYGLGAFCRNVFEDLPPAEPHDLADIYRALLDEGELAAYEADRRFYEIGSSEGIRDFEEHMTNVIPGCTA